MVFLLIVPLHSLSFLLLSLVALRACATQHMSQTESPAESVRRRI
jgi:hypothetical protein